MSFENPGKPKKETAREKNDDGPADPSRRKFLKGLLATGAVAATAGVGADLILESNEAAKEATVTSKRMVEGKPFAAYNPGNSFTTFVGQPNKYYIHVAVENDSSGAKEIEVSKEEYDTILEWNTVHVKRTLLGGYKLVSEN